MSASDTMLEFSRDWLKDQSDTLRHLTTKAIFMLGIAFLLAREGLDVEASGYLQVLVLYPMYICILLCILFGLKVVFPLARGGYSNHERMAGILESHDESGRKKLITDKNIRECENRAGKIKRAERDYVRGFLSLFAALDFFIVFVFFDRIV